MFEVLKLCTGQNLLFYLPAPFIPKGKPLPRLDFPSGLGRAGAISVQILSFVLYIGFKIKNLFGF